MASQHSSAVVTPRLLATTGVLGFAMLALQGCGGGPSGSPTHVPTPAPTPAPTHSRTKPMSATAMAAYLNKQYMGFDEANDASPLGVVISMASNASSFYGNIFCSVLPNPDGNTSCYKGTTDCRTSASLYNHKMIVNKTTRSPNAGLSRSSGIVFNHTLVQNRMGRCSYIWDGATNNRYNVGCGNGAPGNCTWEKPKSAFENICPSTGKTCTVKEVEVTGAFCAGYMGGTLPVPPTHSNNTQCVFPGPAIDYHTQAGWVPGVDYLRDMARNRMIFNNGTDIGPPVTANIEEWNEIVIDERLLLPLIDADPALAIPAIIYVKGPPQFKQMAQQMRDEYCKVNNLAGADKIPLIATVAATDPLPAEGPFSAGEEDFEEEAVVV